MEIRKPEFKVCIFWYIQYSFVLKFWVYMLVLEATTEFVYTFLMTFVTFSTRWVSGSISFCPVYNVMFQRQCNDFYISARLQSIMPCMYHSHYICIGKIEELFNFIWCCINNSPSIALIIEVKEAFVYVYMCVCVCSCWCYCFHLWIILQCKLN